MSTLQWALLLLGAGIVVMLVWSSRREKKALERLNTPASPPASRDWGMEKDAMARPAELPKAAAAAAPAPAQAQAPAPPPAAREVAKPSQPSQLFDEYGVSKPRKVPTLGGVSSTLPPGTKAPDIGTPPPEKAPSLVVGLYIAEHEGTNILGPKIHAALKDRGLRFGLKRIYHRYEGEQPIYSVASLVKPGALDPAEAEGFATPGLSVFMVLPGPARPLAAFQDMLDTARGLARSLNAELYDSEQRAPLTLERERALHEQVEEWARRHAGAARPTA